MRPFTTSISEASTYVITTYNQPLRMPDIRFFKIELCSDSECRHQVFETFQWYFSMQNLAPNTHSAYWFSFQEPHILKKKTYHKQHGLTNQSIITKFRLFFAK